MFCLTGFHLDSIDLAIPLEQTLDISCTSIVLKVPAENLTQKTIKGTSRVIEFAQRTATVSSSIVREGMTDSVLKKTPDRSTVKAAC